MNKYLTIRFYEELNDFIQRDLRKKDIQHLLKAKTKKFYNEFFQCSSCEKVYWKGSHFKKMKNYVDGLIGDQLH